MGRGLGTAAAGLRRAPWQELAVHGQVTWGGARKVFGSCQGARSSFDLVAFFSFPTFLFFVDTNKLAVLPFYLSSSILQLFIFLYFSMDGFFGSFLSVFCYTQGVSNHSGSYSCYSAGFIHGVGTHAASCSCHLQATWAVLWGL